MASLVPVSVIIVSYNTRDHLLVCLGSLGECAEVIVVDNASTDGSADAVVAAALGVVLIQNKVNRGFGVACNQGLKQASHDLRLLLNSDAAATPGAIGLLVGLFKRLIVALLMVFNHAFQRQR